MLDHNKVAVQMLFTDKYPIVKKYGTNGGDVRGTKSRRFLPKLAIFFQVNAAATSIMAISALRQLMAAGRGRG